MPDRATPLVEQHELSACLPNRFYTQSRALLAGSGRAALAVFRVAHAANVWSRHELRLDLTQLTLHRCGRPQSALGRWSANERNLYRGIGARDGVGRLHLSLKYGGECDAPASRVLPAKFEACVLEGTADCP